MGFCFSLKRKCFSIFTFVIKKIPCINSFVKYSIFTVVSSFIAHVLLGRISHISCVHRYYVRSNHNKSQGNFANIRHNTFDQTFTS